MRVLPPHWSTQKRLQGQRQQIGSRISYCRGPVVEDSRRAPVSRLAPGYTVYRRPRMAEEGVPANAELV